jgi:hypothetical protein
VTRETTVDRPLSYAHLLRLSDAFGVVEHAHGVDPQSHHGYCLDDVARALVVLARDPNPPPEVGSLFTTSVDFVLAAFTADGRAHNRRAYGTAGWTDEASCGDWWGRGVWALGTLVRLGGDHGALARPVFDAAAGMRSPFLRSMAYAGLGAAEVLDRHPGDAAARSLLADAADLVTSGASGEQQAWPWPETRLRYANAVLPEVMVAAGAALEDRTLLDRGLALLDWLVDVETSPRGHLSVTPSAGWAPGEPRPGFDQQPIEVAALAEACARALRITGDDRWTTTLGRCEQWFDGWNDVDTPLADDVSGGCHDGLTVNGVNGNEGAESTLALLAVRQLVRQWGSRQGRLSD